MKKSSQNDNYCKERAMKGVVVVTLFFALLLSLPLYLLVFWFFLWK